MKKIKVKKLIISLRTISFAACLTIILIFIQTIESQNILKIKQAKPLVVLEDVNRPSLNYDGTRLVASPEVGLSEVYEVNTGKLLGSYKVKGSDIEIISADGKKVKIFDGKNQTTFEVDTGKMLSQSKTAVYKNGEYVQTMNALHYGPQSYRNYSADLSLIAALYPYPDKNSADSPSILVGNIENHTVVCELSIDDGYVNGENWMATTLTPDGKFVASTRSGFNNKTRNITVVWDVEKRRVIFKQPFYSEWLSMSADGKRLVTGDSNGDKNTEIWDVATGKKISTFPKIVNGRKIQLGNHGVISPDGKLLVTSRAKEIILWDAETGKLLASQDQWRYSESLVKSPTFSGDGKRIAVGSDTEVVTVWAVDEILKIENQTITAE